MIMDVEFVKMQNQSFVAHFNRLKSNTKIVWPILLQNWNMCKTKRVTYYTDRQTAWTILERLIVVRLLTTFPSKAVYHIYKILLRTEGLCGPNTL